MAVRRIRLPVCPGEPTDGSGRICVHLFVKDSKGPFEEPSVIDLELDENNKPKKGHLGVRAMRGRLACDPRRLVAPVTRNGVVTITPRSDDPRAVTCPKCQRSEDYKRMMDLLEKPKKHSEDK